MSDLLILCLEFFKTGLFAVGGGLATLPFLTQMQEKYQWFTAMDLANMIAVSESTPGPIGVNMATYVGFITGMDVAGLPTALLGAVLATLGLITPSVIIILIVSSILNNFRNNKYVERAFYGLRPASTGLIGAAAVTVVISALLNADAAFGLGFFNWKGIVLAVVLFCATNYIPKVKKLHPIVFIGVSALVGILLKMG